MAGFQFPVDDLLLLLLVAVPRVSAAIWSPTSGCTECSVVFKSGALWKLSRILLFMCLSWGNLPESQTKHFYGFPQALPPHLVEKLEHTIMGGSVEASRHYYYCRFSRLFFRLCIQSIKDEHVWIPFWNLLWKTLVQKHFLNNSRWLQQEGKDFAESISIPEIKQYSFIDEMEFQMKRSSSTLISHSPFHSTVWLH